MKRTWIKIKRGILEPKHRRQMGAAWFLFFYMLDLTNWSDGIIYDWKDKDAAADLEMPINTLRDQRRRLEDALYIKTKIKKYGLEITINNWTNPREYSGEIYNKIEGNKKTAPSKSQGDTESDTESTEMLTPLHITHISHNHISKESAVLEKIKTAPILTYESALEESHKLLGKLKQGSERNSTYPVDVRSPITLFEDLTGIKPPRRGEQSYPFWIKSMREVIKVCHEYSVTSANAMADFYEDYKRSGKRFKIITPSSIVKSLRAFLGEEKSEERKYRDVTAERLEIENE